MDALVANFQAISGASEANARRFISQANQNLELALSNYFEQGIEPETVPPPVAPPVDVDAVLDDLVAEGVRIMKEDFVAHLLTADKQSAVPLVGVRCNVVIQDMAADVTVTQRFVNNADGPVEATFVFKHDEAAVYGFEADIGGRKTVGEVQEKEAAFEAYSDAIAARDTGLLLEQGKDEAMLELNIGNLPPGEEATISLSFVTELELDGNNLRFALPATAVPINGDAAPVASTGDSADAITGLSIEVDVTTITPFVAVTCPSHEHEWEPDSPTHGVIRAGNGVGGGRNIFELVLDVEESRTPHAVVEVTPAGDLGAKAAAGSAAEAADQTSFMLSFFPELDEGDEDELTEMIFVVDRSGSMAGGRMRQARNALQLFLRSIPIGTRFNIVGFGSTYEKLFPASRPYNNKTLKAAKAAVAAMDANLIGTNILPPLVDVFDSPIDDRFPRQIFILTDGEVDNTSQVIDMVRDRSFGVKVFTFGIGSDADRTLVRGMALAGNGAPEYVRSGERLEPAVLRQVKRALQPALKNVVLDWGELAGKVAQAPAALPPIFDGDKCVIYGTVKAGETIPDTGSVTLSAVLHDEPVSFEITYDLAAASSSIIVNRLAARTMIRELERQGRQGGSSTANNHKQAVIDLALRYNLLSSFTSFVGVVEQDDATEGMLQTVVIDPVAAQGTSKAAVPEPVPSTTAAQLDAVFGGVAVNTAATIPTNLMNFDLDGPEDRNTSTLEAERGWQRHDEARAREEAQALEEARARQEAHRDQERAMRVREEEMVRREVVETRLNVAAAAPQQVAVAAPTLVAVAPPPAKPAMRQAAAAPPPPPPGMSFGAAPAPMGAMPAMGGGGGGGAPSPFSGAVGGGGAAPGMARRKMAAPKRAIPRAAMRGAGSGRGAMASRGRAVSKRKTASPAAKKKSRDTSADFLSFGAARTSAPAPSSVFDSFDAQAEAPVAADTFASYSAVAPSAGASIDDLLGMDAEFAAADPFASADAFALPNEVAFKSQAALLDFDDFADEEAFGDDDSDDDRSREVDEALLADSGMRALDKFVMLQEATGCWAATGTVARLLGKGVGALGTPASLADAPDADAIWATVLVVLYIEGAFGDLREEWEVLVEKARKWVRRTLKKTAPGVDADSLWAAGATAL